MSCSIPPFDPPANRDQENIQAHLRRKLAPRRFSAMSGKVAALVNYILDEAYVEPRVWELFVTGDGFLLGPFRGADRGGHLLGRLH